MLMKTHSRLGLNGYVILMMFLAQTSQLCIILLSMTIGHKKTIKRLKNFTTGHNSRVVFAVNIFISAAANACEVCALIYILVSIFCFEKMNNIFGKY